VNQQEALPQNESREEWRQYGQEADAMSQASHENSAENNIDNLLHEIKSDEMIEFNNDEARNTR
jgi:hypothetical protein